MAIIQRLRSSKWVAIVIGSALVVFIVGDWLTGKGNGPEIDEDRDVIAVIAGEKVKEAEILKIADKYYKEELERDPNYQLDKEKSGQLFQRSWFDLLKTKTVSSQIEKSGIAVSDEDINELMVGAHPDESIKGDPSFQTDNQFDPKKVEDIFRQAKSNATLRKQLGTYVDRMRQNEIETRYATYVAKARAFTTKVEQGYQYKGSNESVSGKLLAVNLEFIKDGDVKITDSDVKEYLGLNKEKFKITQEKRDFKYVVFNIVPSTEDTLDAQTRALRVAQSYARLSEKPDTLGASGFVRRSDLSNDKMPAVVKDSLWDARLGRVVGPVYKEGVFSVYQKVAEIKDSVPVVNVSHILIPFAGKLPNGTEIKDSIQAEVEAKKVYAMVAGGKTIAELAADYSSDPGSASKGGTYGWANPNQYVAAYKNFCLTATKNQLGLVKTEYGFHIMKMMDDPDYRMIRFSMNSVEIGPGSNTVKLVDEKSRKFKNQIDPSKPETFDKAVEKFALIPLVANEFGTDQRSIGGISDMSEIRQLNYWLFDAKRENNDISEIFAFPTKHVVIKLENVKHVGYATTENVRKQIEPEVRKFIKGKLLAKKMEEAYAKEKDFNKLAQQLNANVVDLDVARFGQGFLPQIGSEFGVLGAVFGLKEGITSNPIIGKESVAIIKVAKVNKVEVPASVYNTPEGDDFSRQPSFMLNRLQEVLMREGNIQDFRYKFEWNN
jgi:parvulin-like peptidyl-prolyl isomerase